jgi:hypothetical protein
MQEGESLFKSIPLYEGGKNLDEFETLLRLVHLELLKMHKNDVLIGDLKLDWNEPMKMACLGQLKCHV